MKYIVNKFFIIVKNKLESLFLNEIKQKDENREI